MPRYRGRQGFRHDLPDATGILLTNLGTPDEPTAPALRRYLREFLSDPRVIDYNPVLWAFILNVMILPRRAPVKAKDYESIWWDEGSPLLVLLQRQRDAIQQELEQRVAGPVLTEIAMRYGNPSIRKGLESLADRGARRILVAPLYPQYADSTVGSTFDAVSDVLKGWRWVPELRMVGQYHDDPGYIDALAASVREHRAEYGAGELLVMSFHGVPVRYLHEGDPYHCQCRKTARLVAERLGLKDDEWMVTFQSRFGNEEWLKPYTIDTMGELPKQGIRNVDVMCPGFSADCLETLEEIAGENREVFLEAGGEQFHYIPALNDRADHISALTELVLRHTRGWPGMETETARRDEDEPAAVADRARALGATA